MTSPSQEYAEKTLNEAESKLKKMELLQPLADWLVAMEACNQSLIESRGYGLPKMTRGGFCRTNTTLHRNSLFDAVMCR